MKDCLIPQNVRYASIEMNDVEWKISSSNAKEDWILYLIYSMLKRVKEMLPWVLVEGMEWGGHRSSFAYHFYTQQFNRYTSHIGEGHNLSKYKNHTRVHCFLNFIPSKLYKTLEQKSILLSIQKHNQACAGFMYMSRTFESIQNDHTP